MPDVQVPLMRGDSIDEGSDYRDELPINYTVVAREIRGAQGYLVAHPGLTTFTTALGIDRGGYWNERQRKHFRVSGTRLITISDVGAVNDIGEITGTDQVVFCHSFNNQSILADGKWWLYDGATLTQNADPNLGIPLSNCWIDSYFFFTDGGFLYHSDITAEDEIDALQFATSEFSPDPTLAVAKTSDNQVIVFNRYTTEYFYNAASDDFAFQRVSGKAVKCGSVGTHSWAEMKAGFIVLGSGRDEATSVQMLQSGRYGSIATREVDKQIALYSEAVLTSVVLETRIHDGDEFLLVRLPDHTLLYNATVAKKSGSAGAWTIVKTGIDGDAIWRGANGVFHPNVGWVYGDLIGGAIGKLDNSVATQYLAQQEFILFSPLVPLKGASVHQIELDIVPGHQVNDGDVTVAISTTYDAVTHSIEQWDLYGEKDIFDNRLIARRLGHVRNFIGFKFRLVTPERTAFSMLAITFGN